jgi:group I intron endonuclease
LAGILKIVYLIEIFNTFTNSSIFFDNLVYSFVPTIIVFSNNNYKKIPFGPHIKPFYLKEPLRLYLNPNLDRNLIGQDNKKRSIIYQWINLITGKFYIGSAWNGSTRLLSYWTPSVLRRALSAPIYNNLSFYGHSNFILAILEDLGPSGNISKESILLREQFYLDLLFNKYKYQLLNLSPNAGSTKGYKHKIEFGNKRSGELNPMFGKLKSQEFLNMQKRDKFGINNPQYGKTKSLETRAKITKLVYVYNQNDMSFIGQYVTANCAKEFKMGKNTLTKYIKKGLPLKGKIFSRKKLH